ncbi:MAG: hypothetical protein JJU11_09135 [Candidatus Sumerlaeia bacterium]|nr:hypothetical protein [Candidatus Sumerlaeia bacterium]
MRRVVPPIFLVAALALPMALPAQQGTPQRGSQSVRQSTSSVPSDRLAPGEAPPDPYEDTLPETALVSQDAMFKALHRQVREMVQTSVTEEINRLRRENMAMENRLNRIADEATRAIRDARDGATGASSPEMLLQRAFQLQLRREINNSLDALVEILSDQETAQLRAGVTAWVEQQTPLSIFRAIELNSGEEGETARLSAPRADFTEVLENQLREILLEGGLVLDENRLEALGAGIGKLSTLEEMRLTLEPARSRRGN